jgi:hypothetical protein
MPRRWAVEEISFAIVDDMTDDPVVTVVLRDDLAQAGFEVEREIR